MPGPSVRLCIANKNKNKMEIGMGLDMDMEMGLDMEMGRFYASSSTDSSSAISCYRTKS